MITYNDFEKYLTKIQRVHEFESDILEIEHNYDDLTLDHVSPIPCWGLTMEDELVDCLEKALDLKPDEYGYTWVSYWVWETDCGRQNTLIEIDGEEVSIAEVYSLWNVIERERSHT